MTTRPDEVEGTTTTTEMTEDQVENEASQQEGEDAFTAGFNKVIGDTQEAGTQTTGEQATEKSAAELEADAKAKREAEERARVEQETADREKAWDGVPQIVREQLEKLQGLPGTIDKLAGHVGNFKRQLDGVLATATAAAKNAGTAAPTDAQVAAAKADVSGKLWDQMKEDFPEWTAAVDERLDSIVARNTAPSVDVDSLKREVSKEFSDAFSQSTQAARQLAQIDLKHEGWETTINTPEFKAYALQGGPSLDRYSEFKALGQTDPAKAGEMLESFKSSFPEWWESKGSALFSGSAKDAITLLDSFSEHRKKAEEEKGRRLSRETRLSRAVTTPGATQPPKTGISDEEAFGRGFKRARGG